MKNRWYRSGNYYKKERIAESLCTNRVTFFNIGKTPVVRRIGVSHYSSGDTTVYLSPSPFFIEKFRLICQTFFKDNLNCLLDYDLVLISIKDDLEIKTILGEYYSGIYDKPILFKNKQENQFSIYGRSPQGKWRLIKNLNADKLKELEFDEEKRKLLLGKHVPNAVYEEITLKEGHTSPYEPEIKLNTPGALGQLIAIFKYFNSEHEITSFSPEIINELKNAWSASHEKVNRIYQHIISESTITDAYINPARRKSLKLLKELDKNLENFSIETFKKYLVEGEDPNQYNSHSAITKAILSHTIEVLKWLILYGADPFLPLGSLDFSPIEAALAAKRHDQVKFIIETFSTIKKSPSEAKSFLVKKILFTPTTDQVKTSIYFNNNKNFLSTLTPSSKLTKKQQDKLYNLFSDMFAPDLQNPEALESIFKEDILEDTLIELIFDQDHPEILIGFNVFQCLPGKKEITVHIVFSGLLPEYRGCAIMSLQTLGFVFALQLLFPELVAGGLFVAIDYKSYRLIEDFLHSPKYLSWREFIKKLLIQIFGEKELRYFQNETVMSYVEDNIRVKKSDKEPPNKNVRKEFFNQEILGLGKDQKDASIDQKPRGAPVYFQASDKNYYRLRQVILNALGLNLDKHLPILASALQPLICKLFELTPKPIGPLRFPKAEFLFFNCETVMVTPAPLDSSHSAQLNSSL